MTSALVKCLKATGITPIWSGMYKRFGFDAFKCHWNHKVNVYLFKVNELQEKERIHACMLLGGLMTRIRMIGTMRSARLLVIRIYLSPLLLPVFE